MQVRDELIDVIDREVSRPTVAEVLDRAAQRAERATASAADMVAAARAERDSQLISRLRDNVSAHDAAYVVLAEALQCPVLTRDTRLARSSGHEVEIRVR